MINVIRTRISVWRNVKDFKFVPKLDEESKSKIVDIVKNALPKFEQVKIGELNDKTATKLYGLQTTNYPSVLVDKRAEVGITFFDGEHLTVTASNFGYDKDVFKSALELAAELKNKISFAYSDEYGYLMSDITRIGNGIKLECDFELSGIMQLNKISQVKQNVQKLGYRLEDTDEENIYTLSTRCNLGFSEKEVLAEFDKMVQKLQELETESDKMLASTEEDEVYDKYVRATAILKNAHIMSFDELKDLIAQVRVGLNLGYSEVKQDEIDQLQMLILSKNSQFVSKSELIDLAKKVKKVLKGE